MLRRRILALVLTGLFACDAPPRRDAEQPDDRVQTSSQTQPTHPTPPPQLGAPEARCQAIQREAIPSDASLVLIVSDTMRRDAASIYRRDGSGLSRARTPHFDAFATDHLLFERAISQAPWTKPSVATLFTSLFPTQHGVSDDPHRADRNGQALREADVISDEYVTLAEIFRGRGFRTAAFISNPWMEARFGFDQGFEVYDDSFAAFKTPGQVVSQAGLAWLETLRPGERFFLYLHYIDAHRPYASLSESDVLAARDAIEADERQLGEEGRRVFETIALDSGRTPRELDLPASAGLIQMGYDGAVENFDAALGDFLSGLARHPSYPSVAVVITSDHGEALFTRGYGNHGRALYEDEIAIPLAMRLPGTRSRSSRIDCLAGLVDLLPTFCDYFDFDRDCGGRSGRSLLAARAGDDDDSPRYLTAEGIAAHPKHRTVQNSALKLHYDPDGPLNARMRRNRRVGHERPYSLYDLRSDPAESKDLLRGEAAAEWSGVARAMAEGLHSAVGADASPTNERAPIDDAMRERLEALGYLGD